MKKVKENSEKGIYDSKKDLTCQSRDPSGSCHRRHIWSFVPRELYTNFLVLFVHYLKVNFHNNDPFLMCVWKFNTPKKTDTFDVQYTGSKR